MEYLLLIAIATSFLVTALAMPEWIAKCRLDGLVWEDMNKFNRPKNVASSGGVVVIMAFILSVLVYVALKTFLFGGTIHALEIFSLIGVILILGIVGLVDDLFGWKNGGLSRRFRTFMAFIASIPLVVISAGTHSISLPFIGVTNLGILYPLILIPVGIAGASTTYNFLAGYNGLEAGQGILILSFLSFVSYITGSAWLAVVGLCMVASLLVFYYYNKVPAKVFPGDMMTYSIGALIAGMAILGNFEKVAIIIFIPYILEVILKVRGGLIKQSFGTPQKNGSLHMPYDKIYGLEHLAIYILNGFSAKPRGNSIGATEKKVTYLIHAFQIIFILIAFFLLGEVF
ncbi:glycosyl transferase family 4 [archaeon]|jgi:UDP-N-acetylglucosamine--dolichyl-phosphate N-acetylglucosaminephosphotransferase|nr:glycosyl transferase family 4 [archaeon]MBT6182798.1 glycosyl transferase family 4 [archaeon]MBT6606112.1 glycosyl transferase family 4 [archaeon]MBT7252048.1 glycosyl transferase family 4 [archaeon]MBT7661003.1 glycosyl transferase family 4 [archaeon]